MYLPLKQYAWLLLGTAVLALSAPLVAFAAPGSFADLVSRVVTIIDWTTPILITGAVVFYMIGIIRTMRFSKSGGEGKGSKFSSQEFKRQTLQGILIIFVLVSVWGIIRIAANTFLSGNVSASPSGFGGGGTCVPGSLDCDLQ